MTAPALFAVMAPIALIQIIGWATPGPNHLTIITASVTSGRGAGLRAALGIAAGALAWTLIAVSGIAIIFEIFPPLFVGLRLVGAAYLVYLGINAFRAARRGGMFDLHPDTTAPATRAPFRTAFVVMMTNPKAVLFFGSILTAFIPPDGPRWLMLVIVLQVGCLAAVLNAIAALFFSHPPVMRAFQRTGYVTSLIFGVLFCVLGGMVIWDTLPDLVS